MESLKPRIARSAFVTLLGVGLGSFLVSRGPASEASAAPARTFDEASAQQTTVVLANALVSAVASVSDATPADADAGTIAANSQAISLLLANSQDEYRLIDATGQPLESNNTPRGRFENDGLDALIGGAPVVQEIVGGHLRTMVPLTNDMHPNCASCHTAFDDMPPGTVVGAASLEIDL